jgi:hypothetical protein
VHLSLQALWHLLSLNDTCLHEQTQRTAESRKQRDGSSSTAVTGLVAASMSSKIVPAYSQPGARIDPKFKALAQSLRSTSESVFSSERIVQIRREGFAESSSNLVAQRQSFLRAMQALEAGQVRRACQCIGYMLRSSPGNVNAAAATGRQQVTCECQ